MTTELVFDTPMMVSAIILVLTFGLIFAESLHHIPRAKIAMVGAAAMVLSGQYFGFYNPEQALEAIDWNVVFLLGAMMTIIAIMIPTGGFQAIAYWIAQVSKGRLFFLLAMVGTAVTGISLMLDNVTTVVIFGPLIILIAQALRVSPLPFLMATAILSNTGGVATLVGDPTALMIGSAAQIDFNTFFFHMGPIVVCVWLSCLVGLMFLFKRKLSVTPDTPTFVSEEMITDKKTWYSALCVLALMVVLFFLHHMFHWEAWVVACLGLTIMMVLTLKSNPDEYLEKVELSLLLFFICLFVVIGGVEHSHFLEWIGTFVRPLVESDLLFACIILMWAAALLSALIDNIPLTAALIPVILGMEAQGIEVTPLWWALAVGAGIGGNGSHLGSTAGVFIVTLTERLAKEENKPSLRITPGLWFRKGTPLMFISLIVASIIMYSFFGYFAKPFPRGGASEHHVEASLHGVEEAQTNLL